MMRFRESETGLRSARKVAEGLQRGDFYSDFAPHIYENFKNRLMQKIKVHTLRSTFRKPESPKPRTHKYIPQSPEHPNPFPPSSHSNSAAAANTSQNHLRSVSMSPVSIFKISGPIMTPTSVLSPLGKKAKGNESLSTSSLPSQSSWRGSVVLMRTSGALESLLEVE